MESRYDSDTEERCKNAISLGQGTPLTIESFKSNQIVLQLHSRVIPPAQVLQAKIREKHYLQSRF